MNFQNSTNGSNSQTEAILELLSAYKENHPNAEIDVRQRSLVSNRIRIVDTDFEGVEWDERESPIWLILDELPDEIFSNITMLLLLTPKEANESLANQEFENPVPVLM